MRLIRRALIVLSIATVGAALAAAPAGAATIKRTVLGNLEFVHGANPTDADNCGALVFVRWKHVPGTTNAKAKYRIRANAPDAVFEERSRSMAPPFQDKLDWIFDPQVDSGHHWISVTSSWQDGAAPDACVAMNETHKYMHDSSPGATTVELTVNVPNAIVKSHARSTRLRRTRIAALGTIRCPAGGRCTVVAPKTVTVRINRVAYKLSVLAPKRVLAGRTASVRVQLPAAAATALARRSVRPNVLVRVSNRGAPAVARRVARTVLG